LAVTFESETQANGFQFNSYLADFTFFRLLFSGLHVHIVSM